MSIPDICYRGPWLRVFGGEREYSVSEWSCSGWEAESIEIPELCAVVTGLSWRLGCFRLGPDEGGRVSLVGQLVRIVLPHERQQFNAIVEQQSRDGWCWFRSCGRPELIPSPVMSS